MFLSWIVLDPIYRGMEMNGAKQSCLFSVFVWMSGVHLLCLIVGFVAFVSAVFVFLAGRDRVDTTTFAAIMTKNGHDQQQTLHVCLFDRQGCLSVCLCV